LVLLETRESYLQIRVQSHCTLRGHYRQGPRNIRYQGALPLLGPVFHQLDRTSLLGALI